MATISIVKGKGNLKHNNRTQKIKAAAKSYLDELKHTNDIIIDKDIEVAYDELFSEALKKFNDKQTRSNRKIKNYYEHISRSKQEKAFYEIIVEIDNIENTEKGSNQEKIYKDILSTYVKEFEIRNPNFKVFQAIGHNDEKSLIHYHIDFIPVSYNNKRGLEVKNSLSGAFEQMGYTRNGFKEWRENELNVLQDMLKEKNIEFNLGSQRDKHFNIAEYKEYAQELKNIKQEIISKQAKLNTINLEYKSKKEYIKSVDKISDVSMMYPEWAKSSKSLLGKEYVTVPKDKWEAKHISADEKNYLKKQQIALESEIKAQISTKSEKHIETLEKEITSLKQAKKALEEENLHFKRIIKEQNYLIGRLKQFYLIVTKGINFDKIENKFHSIFDKLSAFFSNRKDLEIEERKEYTKEKYDELIQDSKEIGMDISHLNKPEFENLEELQQLEHDMYKQHAYDFYR